MRSTPAWGRMARSATVCRQGWPTWSCSSCRARATISPVGTAGAQAVMQLLQVRQVLSGPSAISLSSMRPSMASRIRATRPRAVSHSTGLTTYVGHTAWHSEHLLHSLACW